MRPPLSSAPLLFFSLSLLFDPRKLFSLISPPPHLSSTCWVLSRIFAFWPPLFVSFACFHFVAPLLSSLFSPLLSCPARKSSYMRPRVTRQGKPAAATSRSSPGPMIPSHLSHDSLGLGDVPDPDGSSLKYSGHFSYSKDRGGEIYPLAGLKQHPESWKGLEARPQDDAKLFFESRIEAAGSANENPDPARLCF